MQIATWNVNSVRSRLPRLLPWLEENKPDIVCLQETKVVDEKFPREPIEELGYNVETFGQRTYNGVAILSLSRIHDVVRGLPDDDEDAERRLIGATIDDLLVLNVYVVNGQAVGSEKYHYKLGWLDRLHAFIAESYDGKDKVVLVGDFNITFDGRDIYDPKKWHERIMCSTSEREALSRIVAVGLHDAFREFHAEGGHYTWWDFRTRAFERGNKGLRIDHLLMSTPALDACTGVEIDVDARRGEKPSDHAPVIATLA